LVSPRFTNDSRFFAPVIVVLSSFAALRDLAVKNPVDVDVSYGHSANKKARREADAEPCLGPEAKRLGPCRAQRQLLDGLRYFARGLKCRGMVLQSPDSPANQTADTAD
jgi:hypothetical protein